MRSVINRNIRFSTKRYLKKAVRKEGGDDLYGKKTVGGSLILFDERQILRGANTRYYGKGKEKKRVGK